jgi:hypothetical protein
MKTVTSWMTLMRLAKELGEARMRGVGVEEAQKRHDEYRDLCLKADEMMLHVNKGDLW